MREGAEEKKSEGIFPKKKKVVLPLFKILVF